MMFRDFDCDSLTVPSCDEHNNHKSGDDQRIIAAFLIPLCNWVEDIGKKGRGIHEDVRKAIDASRSSFNRTKRWSFSDQLLRDVPEEIGAMPEVAYVEDSVPIRRWIQQLSAAVVASGIEQSCSFVNWDKVVAWSPDFIQTSATRRLTIDEYVARTEGPHKEAKRLLGNYEWYDGWSACPKPYPSSIYHFKFCFRKHETIILHKFYDQFRWFAKYRL